MRIFKEKDINKKTFQKYYSLLAQQYGEICILCGNKSEAVSLFVPDLEHPLPHQPRGKTRTVLYLACINCIENHAEEIEKILIRQYYLEIGASSLNQE